MTAFSEHAQRHRAEPTRTRSAPRFDLCGCGSMVVDRIWSVPRIAGPDEKVNLAVAGGAVPPVRRAGGVMLNQLAWARLFGLRVAIFGKQADDAEGQFLREWMARLGIEPVLDLSGSASSTAEIYVDAAGQRAIYMAPGATAELGPDEIEQRFAGLIADSHAVSTEVSQLPLASALRILHLARRAGARSVLDLDVPPSAAIPALGSEAELHELLGLAEIVKASHCAAREWTGQSDPALAARQLAARPGVQAAVLTLGAEGAWVCTPHEAFAVAAAAPAAVRDSTGAGDAFLGGLLAGLRSGLAWRDALRLANACGAACCERLGAFPEEPDACRKRALEHYAELGGPQLGLPEFAPSATAPPSAQDAFVRSALGELGRVGAELDRHALSAIAQLVRGAEERGGRTHLTGVGKSAHVARYAAALLASTGTPALYLDCAEATHGSVGQLVAGDVLIALSNSGSTDELLGCVRAAAALGARIVALTARRDSPLARAAELTLAVRVEREAGPLGLPPRTSVLAQTLALSALSVELQAGRDFSVADYHRRHPSGDLGRRSRLQS